MAELLSLADVTYETFKPLEKQPFIVRWPDVTETLVLAEVKLSRTENDPRRKRPPFSLLFRGTTPSLALNQMTHPMSNETLGDMEIFITPIHQEDDGTLTYQACFS